MKSIIEMKYFYLLIVIFCYFSIDAQSFELFGGISKNKFYDIEENWTYSTGRYTSGNNQYIGIGLHHIRVSDIDFGITISYEKYGGNLWAETGGRGGGTITTASIDKSILTMGVLPFNKYIYRKLKLSIGINFSSLIRESFSGTERLSSTPTSSPIIASEELNKKYRSFSTSFLIGFRGALSYDFKISDNIYISPHYAYNIGLFEEFKNFPRATKSMRHQLGIGLKRVLD